jgi:hypothetical protein
LPLPLPVKPLPAAHPAAVAHSPAAKPPATNKSNSGDIGF